jgi:hypothetical protein
MLSDEEILDGYKLAVRTTSTLGVCPMCEGKGYRTTEVLACYHRGEYEDVHHACDTCKTWGFIKTITKEVVATPKVYKTSPKTFYEPYNPAEEAKRKTAKE